MRQLEDRVGLGWRPELAAGILAHADRVDVLEVIADDHFAESRPGLRALRTLGSQIPVVLHGVSMGLASTEPLDRRRPDAMARLVDAVRPEFWSEHLAFVRAGGIEIGHLAAPPRHGDTIAAVASNVERARGVVGSAPLLENVATLLEPPGSDRDEARFTADAVEAAGTSLLLDLHNLHANATNFGFDPIAFLDAVPADRVRAVHLAGGRLVRESGGATRVLDDHLHDVPDPVYVLLREVARRAPSPLTVILERDGRYPPIADLLAELDRARAALREGRRDRTATTSAAQQSLRDSRVLPQAVLARLYVDGATRERFFADPAAAARWLGLTPEQAHTLAAIDREGLRLAACSFERKRDAQRA